MQMSVYPDYHEHCCNSGFDPVTNSGGEYFCDPGKFLTDEESKSVHKELNIQRVYHPIQCPKLASYRYEASNDNFDQRSERSFFLGVAVASVPVTEADPESLQDFGMLLLSRWGLIEQYEVCSHAAMLIVLPDTHVAFLASNSCEFICKDYGGPEVVSAVTTALNDGRGLNTAINAGIKEVGRIVKDSDDKHRAARKAPASQQSLEDELLQSDRAWASTQQAIFFITLAFLVAAVVAGFVFLMLPSIRDKISAGITVLTLKKQNSHYGENYIHKKQALG